MNNNMFKYGARLMFSKFLVLTFLNFFYCGHLFVLKYLSFGQELLSSWNAEVGREIVFEGDVRLFASVLLFKNVGVDVFEQFALFNLFRTYLNHVAPCKFWDEVPANVID